MAGEPNMQRDYAYAIDEAPADLIPLDVMATALELEVIEQRHAFLNDAYLKRYPAQALESKVRRAKEIRAAAVFIRRMIAEGISA